jgi:hypothetical protein
MSSSHVGEGKELKTYVSGVHRDLG